MLYFTAAVLAVAFDQGVKHWVVKNISLYGSQEFIPGLIQFTYIRNDGASWNSFSGMRWFLVSVSAIAVVAIVVVLIKKWVVKPMGVWSLVSVAAGGAGNLIDRIRYGYVVDMFEFLFVSFPIFNIADCFATLGVIVFCAYLVFFDERFKTDKTNIVE